MNSTLTGSSPSRYSASYSARNPPLIQGHPHTLSLIGSRASDCSISQVPLARGARPFHDWLGCRGSCFCGMVAVVPRKIFVHRDPHQSEPGWATPIRCIRLVTELNLSAAITTFPSFTISTISSNCKSSVVTSCRALYDFWTIKVCLIFQLSFLFYIYY